jgi:hypothetical protein
MHLINKSNLFSPPRNVLYTESIEIYRGPGFLAVVWFCPTPTHLPPSRQQVVTLSQSSCVSPVELTDGGEGWAWSQIIRSLAWPSRNHSIVSDCNVQYIFHIPEPVFAGHLGRPGIDFQPGGPVRQPYFSYRPVRLHKLAKSIPRNRFLGSINVYK